MDSAHKAAEASGKLNSMHNELVALLALKTHIKRMIDERASLCAAYNATASPARIAEWLDTTKSTHDFLYFGGELIDLLHDDGRPRHCAE